MLEELILLYMQPPLPLLHANLMVFMVYNEMKPTFLMAFMVYDEMKPTFLMVFMVYN